MRRTRCLRDCNTIINCNTIIRYENRERRVLFAALPVFLCVEMLRGTWTRRLRVSVIQRGTQAVESPRQGHTPNCGRGRVAASSVILAKRGSHTQGQSSTLSLPVQTNRGIPARSARMTAMFGQYVAVTRQNHSGDSSVASLPLNDVHKYKCAAWCGGDNTQALNDVQGLGRHSGRDPPHVLNYTAGSARRERRPRCGYDLPARQNPLCQA
mgnify:CR=1 FL=1